jgi:hypothetical protein
LIAAGTSFAWACDGVRDNFSFYGVTAMAQAAIERASSQSDHSEGSVAKMIEEQTAKLPSDVFLWAACGSIVGSLAFQLMGDEKKATFVGQWAPTLLILGLYNKMVKLHGSE